MNARTPEPALFIKAIASPEAEQAVIGALLLRNGAYDLVSDLLRPEHFFNETNKVIYAEVCRQITASKSCDVITVAAALTGRVTIDELNGLAQYVPSAANVHRYAQAVVERYKSRALLTVSAEIAELAQDHDRSIEDRVELAQAELGKLTDGGPSRDDWQESSDGMVLFIDELQRRADGEVNFLSTGLTALDDLFDGGMREGEVIVLAARPSMGKTALGLTIGENVAQDGHAVGILSMEMPKAQVHGRRVSMHSRIPLQKLKRPERLSPSDWSAATESIEAIGKLPVFVSDQTGLTISQIRTKARPLKRRHGLRVLVIDYIGLAEGTDRKANRTTQLAEVSRGLKSLAKELGITILLLAQLNREVEKRPNNRPILSDLRECGDLEQDADAVVFIHRPYHVKPELGPEWKHYAELIVAKNRDGQVGLVDAQYVGETVRFYDWTGARPTSMARSRASDPI